MHSKALATTIIGIGCIAAAAAAGYLALRQNQADAQLNQQAAVRPAEPAPTSTQPNDAASAPTAAPQAVPAPVEAAHTPPAQPEQPVAKAQVTHAAKPAPADKKPKPSPTVETPATTAPQAETVPAQTPDPVAPRPVTVPTSTSGDAPVPIVIPPMNSSAQLDSALTPVPPAGVPEYLELTIAAQSVIGIRLDASVSSETAHVEDRVTAHVTRDVTVSGHTAIPAGARLEGSVTTVDKGGKFKEHARLGVKFTTLYLADGSRVALQTETIFRDDDSSSSAAVAKVGGGAVVGTILGAILGGKKGAAIGAAAGGGAGATAVAAGKNNEAVLNAGTTLTVQLSAPATITVQKTQHLVMW